MTKRILTVLFFALICITGYAQSKFTPEWNFGANFGGTFSSVSFVTTDPGQSLETKMVQHFKAGLSARYMTEKHLGLIAELNYSVQGYEQKFPDAAADSSKFVQDLAYIQIPFLTHIYFGNKQRVFLNMGPQVGYLVGQRKVSVLWSTDYDTTKPSAQYVTEVQHKLDYGLVVGLGFELRTGVGNFSLEGRYYLGFSDIYSSHKTDPFSRSANRVMSVGINYYMKPF